MVNREVHEKQSEQVRRAIISLLHTAGGGHFGGSLSLVDLLLVIWRDFLRLEAGPERDRFVLSKGHGAAALYCTLDALGLMPPDMLSGFGRDPVALSSHPEIGRPPLCDFSTGSLGQGLSGALGMALVLRGVQRRAWAVLGDGECQEGQVWEAAMLAARLRVSNLIAVVDCNGRQEWGYRLGPAEPVMNLADKWKAFGWRVAEVDGHDPCALWSTFERLEQQTCGGPTVVLATTIKGHGVPFMVADPDRFHCTTLSDAEFASCLA